MADFLVCIDAGHGQYGNAGSVKGYYEGTQMFKLSMFELAEWQKYQGVQAIVTRGQLSDDPDLLTRGKAAAGYDLFISNHSNAPGTAAKDYASIRGTSIYDSVTRPTKELADGLGKIISDLMGHDYRGTHYRESTSADNKGLDWYGVLRFSIRYGCKHSMLVEHGFHTNAIDAGWLMEDDNLRKLAAAKVKFTAAYFGLKLKTAVAPATGVAPAGKVYRVQVGAFRNKAGAEAHKATVIAKGFKGAFVQSYADGWHRVQVGAFEQQANAKAYQNQAINAGFIDAFVRLEAVGSPALQNPYKKPASTFKLKKGTMQESDAVRWMQWQLVYQGDHDLGEYGPAKDGVDGKSGPVFWSELAEATSKGGLGVGDIGPKTIALLADL